MICQLIAIVAGVGQFRRALFGAIDATNDCEPPSGQIGHMSAAKKKIFFKIIIITTTKEHYSNSVKNKNKLHIYIQKQISSKRKKVALR